jgi:hypothetical protein
LWGSGLLPMGMFLDSSALCGAVGEVQRRIRIDILGVWEKHVFWYCQWLKVDVSMYNSPPRRYLCDKESTL